MPEETVQHIIESTIKMVVQVHGVAETTRNRIKIWKYISALELLQKAAFSDEV